MSTEIRATAQPSGVILPEDAGPILLGLARNAIATGLGSPPCAPFQAQWLLNAGASFVTLIHEDKLRGCVGTLTAHRGLGADINANAIAAAFRDPRFKPVTRPEFDALSVEVSVLSSLEALQFRDEDDALSQLRPEIDGVVLEYGHHRSTFLPQVWKDFPEPQIFLSNLKYKAGLPPDFWDAAARLSRYTVTKWRETSGA